MKKRFCIAIFLLLTSACTAHPKVAGMSQSATVIKTKDTARVIGKLAEICDRNGFQVEASSTNNLSCSQQSPLLAQALLGTKYGTEVRSMIKFSVFPVGNDGTRAVGYMSMGNQTAFGQNNVTDLGAGGKSGAQVQRMLDQARSELEGNQ